MSFFSNIIDGIRHFYSEINTTYLTGAIDVIVVQQEDGTFKSSPFHVRFGKLGVMKAKEKIVVLEINGEEVSLQMKLDDSGSAFFVEEDSTEKEESPEHKSVKRSKSAFVINSNMNDDISWAKKKTSHLQLENLQQRMSLESNQNEKRRTSDSGICEAYDNQNIVNWTWGEIPTPQIELEKEDIYKQKIPNKQFFHSKESQSNPISENQTITEECDEPLPPKDSHENNTETSNCGIQHKAVSGSLCQSNNITESTLAAAPVLGSLAFFQQFKLPERYKKTLRPSSSQLKSLNLKQGCNEIQFSVTTALQGTTACVCHIYLWHHTDKIVISDIDGTITKSDVFGHILPMIGQDWSQSGVAQLFSQIQRNGYHIMYLSARAICQSSQTNNYLHTLKQGNTWLPHGPLFLNPDSLFNAAKRELIDHNPEEFKIQCLQDIQSLFEKNQPFFAGYGNRPNDSYAYKYVGIYESRIFSINPVGELSLSLTSSQKYQTSYYDQINMVDLVFPPLLLNESGLAWEQFSSFGYWRNEFMELANDHLL